MPTLYDFTSDPSRKRSMRNAGMFTTTRVSDGTAFGPFNICAVSFEASAGSPLDQYSFANLASSCAFCSPMIERISCSLRSRGLPSELSTSSALFSRSCATAAPETRLSSSTCWSESLTFCLRRVTNFSSVNNASSSGNVIWTDAVSVFAGDGDAVGDGLGCVETVVFELLGAGAQPASKITNHERIKSRRIMVILNSSNRCVPAVNEQRAFQRGVTVYERFLDDLRTIVVLSRSVV